MPRLAPLYQATNPSLEQFIENRTQDQKGDPYRQGPGESRRGTLRTSFVNGRDFILCQRL
jgi:hypothetical protein